MRFGVIRVQQLIEDDLNKCSAKHANKSTLVARGADTQLGSSCTSAPLATNVDLWNPTACYRSVSGHVAVEAGVPITPGVTDMLSETRVGDESLGCKLPLSLERVYET